MAKRHEIVACQLQKYPVAEDMGEILDRLSFRELSSSQVPDWKMFTRRNGNNEFAAIYGDKEFFVEGPYSSIEVPQRDLENVTRYVFNEGWISKKIREKSMIPVMAFPVAGIAAATYDLLDRDVDFFRSFNDYLKSIDPSTPEYTVAAMLCVFGVLGGMFATEMGMATAKNLLNRYYGSKLSREAENYNYGYTGEDRLREEFIFERVKSGEMKKPEFLKLRGYEQVSRSANNVSTGN